MSIAAQIPEVTSDALERLRAINTKLRLELEQMRARRSGSYRLRYSDVIDLGQAWREIDDGQVKYGLWRLECVLDELEPRWREMT